MLEHTTRLQTRCRARRTLPNLRVFRAPWAAFLQHISECQQTHVMYDGTYNPPPIELKATLKTPKLTSLPSSLGNSPAKVKMLANHIQRMYAGTYDLPRNRLRDSRRSFRLISLPSSLGNFPAKKWKCQQN